MDPYIGEIRTVGFNFAPSGWALCNGQLLSISSNTALFSLLGINFGGDGRSTFGLPNLQGMVATGQGQGPGLSNYVMGQTAGSQTVTLLASQIPSHTHTMPCEAGDVNAVSAPSPTVFLGGGAGRGGGEGNPFYVTPGTRSSSPVAMAASADSPAGGNQPHNNMAPYLTLYFVIAIQGLYPPRS